MAIEVTTYKMDNFTNSSTSHSTDISIDNLYPAIVQCFVIIFAGYMAGRANFINAAQGKGIGEFVGKFCLPALLFKSMVELDFSSVNWQFMCGIAISKSVVFLGVVVLTLLVRRPLNLGLAGLFGIFATQSNDFALGYPIIQALYQKSHPEYLSYIYLVAPISLVLLNPIGFIMMEIHRRHQDTSHQSQKITIVLHIIKDVLTNPIVFMSIIGIIGNFLFKQKMPGVVDGILTVLGNAYSASALFYLGLSLVGKMSGNLGMKLAVPLLLIGAKTLLLPLITWQMVGALEMDKNNSKSLSMYGFLYGTFPTAPSVFLYSSQFAIGTDIIATGMVACTFLSAPLMFVSAKMMTVVVNSEMDYKSMLLGTSFDFSIISLVCCTWVLALLLFSKKYRKVPHMFLICLVLSQMFSCIGMIVYDGVDATLPWQHYTQFVILLSGVLASRCWVPMISVALYLVHCRSLCFVLRHKVWMFLFGFGVPILSTGLLLLFGQHHMHNEIDPSFHYGIDQIGVCALPLESRDQGLSLKLCFSRDVKLDQAIMSVVVLFMCSVINITFLVLRQRNTRIADKLNKNKHGKLRDHEDTITERLLPDDPDIQSRSRSSSHQTLRPAVNSVINETNANYNSCTNCSEGCGVASPAKVTATNIEDIVPFPSAKDIPRTKSNSSVSTESADSFLDTIDEHSCLVGHCSYQQRRKCAGLLRCYHATSDTVPVDGDDVEVRQPKRSKQDEYQTGRFVVLLLFSQISMLTGLFLCSWRLFNNFASGIYVEIEFLDSVLNYGQGLVVFAIFGFDTRLVILPCIRRLSCFRGTRCKWLWSMAVRWRRCMYGVETVSIPDRTELPDETLRLCESFIKYHKDNCMQEIVKDMKYRFRSYNQVFCGMSLCDWLMKAGLCQSRDEAVSYGRSLLIGQVISHVTSEHDFHDMPYFYRFVEEECDFSSTY